MRCVPTEDINAEERAHISMVGLVELSHRQIKLIYDIMRMLDLEVSAGDFYILQIETNGTKQKLVDQQMLSEKPNA